MDTGIPRYCFFLFHETPESNLNLNLNLNLPTVHMTVKKLYLVDPEKLGSRFAPLYSQTGRHAKPIRLMTGLLFFLRSMFNLSDE